VTHGVLLAEVDRVLRGNVAAKLLREINLPLLAAPLGVAGAPGQALERRP